MGEVGPELLGDGEWAVYGEDGRRRDRPPAGPPVPVIDNHAVVPTDQPVPGRCGALRVGGGYCKRFPLRGGRRCVKHGQASPQGRRAAAEEVARRRAAAGVARLGGRLDIDPAAALELIWQGAAADVVALEAMVGALGAGEVQGPPGAALSRMLHDAREVARRAAKSALDAGVDERRVRVSEATTARIIAAVVGGLEDVGPPLISAEALPAVRAAIGRRLRASAPSAVDVVVTPS